MSIVENFESNRKPNQTENKKKVIAFSKTGPGYAITIGKILYHAYIRWLVQYCLMIKVKIFNTAS